MGGLGVGLTSKLTQNQNKTSPHKFFSPCGSEPSTKLNQCDGQLYTILSRLFYENNWKYTWYKPIYTLDQKLQC